MSAAVIGSTSSVNQTTIRLLDEAEALDQLSGELHTKVSEVVSAFDSK